MGELTVKSKHKHTSPFYQITSVFKILLLFFPCRQEKNHFFEGFSINSRNPTLKAPTWQPSVGYAALHWPRIHSLCEYR